MDHRNLISNVKVFQELLNKFKDFQGLEFLFQIQGHLETFMVCTNPV